MKNKTLLFRMAARCEAAGRQNNEDNYQIDADLSDYKWGFTADAQIELGKKGALLVVCDGMGGMNAGEVASAIAVETIKSRFAADLLTDNALAEPMVYIKNAIVAADAAIKKHSKEHPETAGMGSTIALAWLLGKKVYVGWCGDSRCYCYNSKTGLVRLSHDHSYVQELVDAGKLTEELAFDHPNNNIITRSLGDPNGTARPDVKEYDLHNEDILLLCSDGLCGCLRDKEIEEQIAVHQTSMQECRDALWGADEAAGWHDNVTIALAQILCGAIPAVATDTQTSNSVDKSLLKSNERLKIAIAVLAVLLVAIIAAVGYKPAKQFISARVIPTEKSGLQLDSILGKEIISDLGQDTLQNATSETDKDSCISNANVKYKPKKRTKATIDINQLGDDDVPEVQKAEQNVTEHSQTNDEGTIPEVLTEETEIIPDVKTPQGDDSAAAIEKSADKNASTEPDKQNNN